MMKANFLNLVGSCRTWVVLVMLALLGQTQVSAQCTMTCNSLVNISLDQTCSATLLPDQIAEGDLALTCPTGNFQVQAKINGVWQPATGNFVVTSAHIGQTLEVRVRDLASGNSCWGHIFVEDKLAPQITCANVTVSCATSLAAAGGAPVVVENCGTATVSSGIVEEVDVACTQLINGQAGMSYAVKRVWTATDASGNFATCEQWIYFRRVVVSPATIVCPADVTITNCANPNTNPSATGFPTAGGVSLGNAGFCEINVTHNDQIIDICDGSYKILRTWTVINWCAPTAPGINPFICIQLIKVLDEGAPVVDCPTDLTVSTDPNSCDRDYNLPDVLVTDACSRLASFRATYTVNGVVVTLNGGFANFPGNNLWNPDTLGVMGTANNLPLGPTTVTYTITDDCGNVSTCVFKVTVVDQIPPTAVCDEHTIVAIGQGSAITNQQGMALVNASTFDDGSYDNCGPVYFKARRMDANGCQDNNQFHDQVKFCCSDIGTTILVVFRAYDANPGAGSVSTSFLEDNANDCMVEVEVQDKLRPTCQAPANVTVACESFDPSLWAYGTAIADDNCCLDTVTESRNMTQFDTTCNRGVITRTFRAFDCAGLSSVCTQRVTVTYNQDYFLHLPGDRIVNNCDPTGNYGEPVIFDEDCELVGSSYTDEIITVVPDACYKIVRTWRISNWCTYNPDLPCVFIPNPNPNAILNHPSNLNAPFLKVTPFSAGNLSVPVDFRSTLVSITPGAAQTDYTSFYQANANCYEYNQIIKVLDNNAPVIANCPAATVNFGDVTANDGALYNNPFFNDPIHNIHDLCEMPVDLSINASDLCAGTNLNVRYLLFLDTDNSGDMETVVNSANPPAYGFINVGNAGNANFAGGTPLRFDSRPVPGDQVWRFGLQQTVAGGVRTARVGFNTLAAPNTYVLPQLPHGTHKIKWLVQDGCGNEATCEYTFVIRDTKPPTVVCLNGISVNIMPTGMIQIWDTELLQYTVDNCTPDAQMAQANKTAICTNCTSFPLDAQGNPIKQVTFTCSQLGTQTVRIWSRDAMGNADYCETYVLVQDNAGNCPGGNKSVAGATKGTDKNGTVQGAQAVNVALSVAATNATPATNAVFSTINSGSYSFLNAVPVAGNATVTPVKDVDHLNGVNMLDVLKIQRHILGLEPLPNVYRQIAADVNNSRSITSSDIVELRKLILGAYTELPAVNSWRFVDKSFSFANANNAFVTVFPEMVALNNVTASMMDVNFESVKSGDVTGDAVYNTLQVVGDRSAGTLYFDAAEANVTAGQEFTVNFKGSAAAEAVQFTMNLNGLEVVGTDLDAANYAVHNGALAVATEANSFAITFRATAAGSISKMISASSKITEAVAFQAGDRYDVAIRFNGVVAGAGFELMQNVPNPVKSATSISFNLPEAGAATLTFTNVEGRVIKVVTGDFAKGINTVNVNRADLSGGVIFYQLDSQNFSDVKKMIVVE